MVYLSVIRVKSKPRLWDIKYRSEKFSKILVNGTSILQLEQTDVDMLVNAFNQPTLLRKKGLYFNEVYYTCIRADNEAIYGKEVRKSLLWNRSKDSNFFCQYCRPIEE